MKKSINKIVLMIALCIGAVINTCYAQNDADPALTSFSFAVSPIAQLNTTSATLTFINNGFTTAIATGSVGINITLPTSGEYTASPQSTAALSGTLLSKFNFTYNAATKNFFGVSNQAIQPGDGGTIVVKVMGVIAVVSRTSVANIQRLNPSAYPNENINNNNLSASLGVVAGGPLAIGLLNFNAVKQGRVVNLDWQTTAEQNSSGFEIAFSRDGNTFQTIGTVAAAGNSTALLNYAFVHVSPVTGINYYRLKLINTDGSFVYSPVRTVKFGINSEVIVSPNPTQDRAYINSGTGDIFKSVAVYSSDGKLMMQANNFKSGNSIDISSYMPAVYLFRITESDGRSVTVKVIKK